MKVSGLYMYSIQSFILVSIPSYTNLNIKGTHWEKPYTLVLSSRLIPKLYTQCDAHKGSFIKL